MAAEPIYAETRRVRSIIEKLTRLPLPTVWPHEASDFTRWLVENIDQLSDALPFDLNDAKPEQPAGTSRVDLVATDPDGAIVVVENQLYTSDHGHLGKLLTYLATYDAKRAIWIVADARPEHIQAVTWFDESELAEFYLMKLEAVKIGDSQPAALFTMITGPNAEILSAGRTKKAVAEADAYRDFTRYNVTINGTTEYDLPKNRAFFKVVNSLCDTGVSPEDIQSTVSINRSRFRYVEGTVNSDVLQQTLAEEESAGGKRFDPRRYFCRDSELIKFNGRTYVFSNQWGGPQVFEMIQTLIQKYPDKQIACSPSNDVSIVGHADEDES